MNTSTLAVALLATLAVGGVVYALLYPTLSGEKRAEKRRKEFAGPSTVRGVDREAQARNKRGQVLLLRIGQGAQVALEVVAAREHGGQLGQHLGVDAVGLGQLPHRSSELAPLPRVDDCHRQAGCLQRAGKLRFVAAGGLHENHRRPQRRERGHQRRLAFGIVGKAFARQHGADCRNIDVRLGDVDPNHHGVVGHGLRNPSL